MGKSSLFALTLLGLLIFSCVGVKSSVGASPALPIQRIFYFSGGPGTSNNAGTLNPSRPAQGPSTPANLSRPVQFSFPPGIQSPTTVLGDLNFSLWTSWKGNNVTLQPTLKAEFDYKLPAQDWVNTTSSLPRDISRLNTTMTILVTVPSPGIALTDRSLIAIRILSSDIPENDNITLNWGSLLRPSLVTIPMIGYQALYQPPGVNPISITDGSGTQTNLFQLNAALPANIVLVKALVISALGLTDIRRVNMTIIDPNGHPIRGETSRDMDPPLLQSAAQPYQYEATWSYRPNATQGQYQIWIDVIDSQNNTAFSFRGPASYSTFQLVPPGYIPFPYNLYPYFIIGGVVAGGGAYYYRNRRRRSYLVPFEHFSALTGGGLDDGTITTIEGNTGSGKSILSEQLMYEDLRNGRHCVFVTTNDFPNNIRSKMATMGLNISGYEQTGALVFIDGYSSEAGQESHEKVALPSLSDLTTLGVKISSLLPADTSKGASLYFDSLSPLTSKAKPESIVSFVQSVGAKVKGLPGKAFFTLGPGIDYNVQRQLEESADCIVQMEAFEESGARHRRLRIAKLRAGRHQEGWTRFTIEDGKGIIFYSRKPGK